MYDYLLSGEIPAAAALWGVCVGAAAAGHSFSTAPRFVGSEIFCELREISAAAEIPVSYTHLTLPTILRV